MRCSVVCRPGCCFLLFAAASFAGEPAPAPKFPQDRPADMGHIRIEARVDLQEKVFAAVATLDAVAQRPLRSVRLNAVDFEVERVLFAFGEAAPQPCEFENDGEHVIVLPGAEIPADRKFRIIIHYRVQDPTSGLSFFSPDDDPDAPYLMWSQGQSITNRYWVPCFDHPNEMQTTEIVCTVARPYMAISNGRLLKQLDNEDGTRTFHWLQSQPHVAYLMTLVVGEFERQSITWRGRPVEYYARPKYADRIERTFRNTPRMLDFFSDKIGVEYPWDKYAQVCCYGFGGGMENTSATTMREMMLHDERAMLDDDEDGLIAHELAHQWWGDLLTCADWAHLWLNEGFASYFEALWDEHNLGPDEFAYNMSQKARGAIDGGKDRPIVDRRYPDPDSQFDSRAYPKGAWVLHMIRRRLGDELFWKAIQTYCTRHQHQTVETDDLRRAIEDVTGRSFGRFFYDWTERPGCPVVTIRYEWLEDDEMASIRVRQTQKDEAFVFPLTVEFCFTDDEAPPIVLRREIDEKDVRIFYPLPRRPEYIRVDPNNEVLMDLKLELPRGMNAKLLAKDANVVGRIRAAGSLGRSMSRRDIRILAKALPAEKFWGVQAAIARALGDDGSDEARDALLAGLKLEGPKARRAIVEQLGNFPDDKAAKEALAAVLEKGDPSYRVEAAAIEAYARLAGEEGVAKITPYLEKDSDWDILRRAALRGLGDVGSQAAASTLIEWSAAGKPRPCRSAAVEAIGQLLSGEVELDDATEKQCVEAVMKCLSHANRRMQFTAVRALGMMGDRARPALEKLDKLAAGSGRIKGAAKRAAEQIRGGSKASAQMKDLRESIDQLRKQVDELKDEVERMEAKGKKATETE